MKFVGHRAAALVLVLACSPALAEEPMAAAFLERLAGEWKGGGEVSGKDGALAAFGSTHLTRDGVGTDPD